MFHLFVFWGVWPVIQLEEDAQQTQAHTQPQPAHGRVSAMPQEIHQERLPQSPHGERPRRNGELETTVDALTQQGSVIYCSFVLYGHTDK